MSDREDRRPPELEDSDMGSPIEELASFERAPSRGFVPRLKRRIARRQLTGQVVELSTIGPPCWCPLGCRVKELFVVAPAIWSCCSSSRPNKVGATWD